MRARVAAASAAGGEAVATGGGHGLLGERASSPRVRG